MKEDALQKQVAKALDKLSGTKFFWFHTPNGGLRNIRVAQKLKSQGVKAGVWDCWIVGRGAITYLIELKIDGRQNHKNGGLSDNQVNVRDRLIALGIPEVNFSVCYSLDDVLEALKRWKLI